MRADDRCQVSAAIELALDDAARAFDERGIILVKSLEAKTVLATEGPALHQALYTIFRGLPDRLAPGATLLVSTRDRAGGDVELIWEARELASTADESTKTALTSGPHGDLLELALEGLDAICGVRSGHQEEPERLPLTSNVLQRAPHVRRRYLFLIPSLVRAPDWAPKAELKRS